MCWNAGVSLNTFLFSAFAVGLALGNRVITVWGALFLLSFMSMQFVEFLVWSHPAPEVNRRLSMAGLLLLLAQPVFSLLCIDADRRVTAALPLLAAYAAFVAVLLTLVKPWSAIDFRSVRAVNGHLAWKWLDFPVVVMCVWMAFLTIRYALNAEWVQLGVVLATAGLSYALFYRTETWGSMWCWVSNAIALFLLYKTFTLPWSSR